MNRFLIKTAQNLGCTWEPVLERRERKREREKEKERPREREKESEREGRVIAQCCNYYSSEGMATNASWLSLYLEQLCSIIFLHQRQPEPFSDVEPQLLLLQEAIFQSSKHRIIGENGVLWNDSIFMYSLTAFGPHGIRLPTQWYHK